QDPQISPEFSEWGPSTAAARETCSVILAACVASADKGTAHLIPTMFMANASGGFTLFWRMNNECVDKCVDDTKCWKCDIFGFGTFRIVFSELSAPYGTHLIARGRHLLDPDLSNFHKFLNSYVLFI